MSKYDELDVAVLFDQLIDEYIVILVSDSPTWPAIRKTSAYKPLFWGSTRLFGGASRALRGMLTSVTSGTLLLYLAST